MYSDRQSTNSAYNFDSNLGVELPKLKKKKEKMSKIQKAIRQKQNQEKNKKKEEVPGFYYNIQVIRKVATFLQNVKLSAVRVKQQLTAQEAFYLQNEENQNQISKNLIGWENPLLLIFQLLFLFLIVLALWTNSFEIVFEKQHFTDLLNVIFLIFHLTYIAIYLNTEHRNQKLQTVNSRRLIFNVYLRKKLPYDLIILIGIILQLSGANWAFYPSRLMIICVFYNFKTLLSKFQNKFAVSMEVESIIGILKLFSKIMLFIHFLTLTFNIMSKIQRSRGIQVTWIEKQNLSNSSSLQLYVYGWYWASTIIATVGFGDITPASNISLIKDVYECGFISIIELLSSVMFGYSVNYIGTMLGVFGESKATYEKDIRRLNKYLKTLTIPKQLEDSIRSHFFNKYQIEQVYDAQSQHYLFMKLTQKLKSEVNQTNNLNIIKRSKMLSVFSEQALQNLSGIMKKTVYAPSQVLFDETSENIKLFLMEEGQVNELPLINKLKKKQKPIITYDKQNQNTIGWKNILTGNAYSSLSKANTYTITYEISRSDFISILQKYPKDYLKFQRIRQSFFHKPIQNIKNCLVCGRLTHSAAQCPKIHYVPRKLDSLLLHNKKQQLSKKNKRIKSYHRQSMKPKRVLYNHSQFMDQINQDICNSTIAPDNNQNTIIKEAETSLGNQLKGKTIPNIIFQNRQRVSLENRLNKQKQQRFSNNVPNQLTKSILNIQNQIKRSINSIKKFPQDAKYPSNVQINYEYNQAIANNESIFKKLFFNHFDMVMSDQSQDFFPNFNVKEVIRLLEVAKASKSNSKFNMSLAQMVQLILD